jgi:hypothetical protein
VLAAFSRFVICRFNTILLGRYEEHSGISMARALREMNDADMLGSKKAFTHTIAASHNHVILARMIFSSPFRSQPPMGASL